jgi:hypothetical protein
MQIYDSIDGMGTYNTAVVERTERPAEGGILAYLYGYKYPYKGIPDTDSFNGMHNLKRTLSYILITFKDAPAKGKGLKILIVLLAILPKFITGSIIDWFLHYIFILEQFHLRKTFLKHEKYCTSVREIKRALEKVMEGKEGRTKKVLAVLKDIGTNILEIDSAYRFRFQDIMNEAKKEELSKPGIRQIHEIRRLSGILKNRERSEMHMKFKWHKISQYAILWLYWSRKTRHILAEFFKELDFEKVKPDAGDDYFNSLRQDYKFKGKSLEQRILERSVIEGANWHLFSDLAEAFLKESKAYK